MLHSFRDYYRKAFVTDHPLIVLLGNLRAPSRFVKKLCYDQICGKIPGLSKTTPTQPANGTIDHNLVDSVTRQLKDRGIAILPSYFAKEAKEIWDAVVESKEKWPVGDLYYRTFCGPFGHPAFPKVTLDETVLSIAAKHYDCQPYLRVGPCIAILNPENTTVTDSLDHPAGLKTWPWHIDTANLLSFHVILNDTGPEDTRMLFADESHKVHRSASGIRTEKNVRDRYKVTDCYGPQGTLYIFDNNGLHRPHAVAKSFRATYEFYFTPGNQIQNMEKMRGFVKADMGKKTHISQGYGPGAFDNVLAPDDCSPLQREAVERLK
ncbi:MAG: hypothetical protein A2516_08765 [Alphaproteobacteria bacterium RIFOXYD12_FULL_60_8]|nr:MAG: hypothetical protein A2516_08765 [Alphaproteobacteria bacterium RIFOXYD12_FULL_60_8]